MPDFGKNMAAAIAAKPKAPVPKKPPAIGPGPAEPKSPAVGGYGGLPAGKPIGPTPAPAPPPPPPPPTLTSEPSFAPVPEPDSGGGGDGGTVTRPQTDWSDLLSQFGLPADLVSEANRLFGLGYSVGEVIAWIRGTAWYAATYPGISEGIAKGVVSNEKDYRSYVNAVNLMFRRYYDRALTVDETRAFLKEGVTPTIIGQRLEGQAYVKANRGDIQYYSGAFGEAGQLTEDQLRSYGEQRAGLGSQIGAKIERSLQLATQSFQRAFQGQLSTPGFSLTGASVAAPGLRAKTSGPPDIRA